MDALMQRPESGSVDTERLRSVLAERSIALGQELGRGGMSAVYLARDLRHRRLVAVKILRPGIPTGAERHGIEAAIRRHLHPPRL